jgi:hypothetical protein
MSSNDRPGESGSIHRQRRRILQGLGSAGAVAAAGCFGGNRNTPTDTATDTPGTPTETDDPAALRFVSSPDFFNYDIPHPFPGYDPAVEWVFAQVLAESPAFMLVAGDMVDGRWHTSAEQVRHLGHVYYAGWRRRFEERDLPVHTVMGDHERGDDPWGSRKRRLQPEFEDMYRRYFDNPENGPEGKEGLTYAIDEFVDQGLLLVGIDTWDVTSNAVRPRISANQLGWLEDILSEYGDTEYVVVQGHCSLTDAASRSSSGIQVQNAEEFAGVMADNGVTAYLAGEFHQPAEDLWQVVHGAAWGRVESINYLVGVVTPEKLRFRVKEFPIEVSGETWNANKSRGPAEEVEIPDPARNEGPRTIGSLTLTGGETTRATGVFD